MSRKPSKFRKRKREQRDHRTLVSVDFETRTMTKRKNGEVISVETDPMAVGRAAHKQLIEGHYHVGDAHLCDQVMAYAHGAGIDEVTILRGAKSK